MKNKILNLPVICLLLVIVLACFGMSVSAAQTSDTEIATASVDVSKYGTPVGSWKDSSSSVTASLYNDPNNSGYYILVIDGTGAMSWYSSSSSMPWYSYRTKIKSVIFGEGVTSVGMRSFYNHTALTNVIFSNTIHYIYDYAFYGCSALSSIVIPDGVTDIGYHSFDSCSSLSSITIGKGVTYIDQYAFYNCKYVKKMNFNATDTYVSDYAFYNVGASSGGVALTIGKNVKNFSSWAFDYSSNRIYLTSITFESGSAYTSLPGRAFYGQTKLTSVTLPESLVTIGNNAFYGCTALKSITIPKNVTDIGNSAFYGCSALTSLNIQNSPAYIGDSAFYNCKALQSVNLGNAITSIGSSAFYYCSKITSLTIPSTVTRIGGSAFYNCSKLASVNIPSGITVIDTSTFRYCYDLEEILIPSSVIDIGSYAFYYCRSLKNVTLQKGLNSIGSQAFWGCSALTDIEIPDSVTSVFADAFDFCSGLKTVKVGSGVSSLYLENSSLLTSVTVSASNPHLKSVDGNLYSKDGKHLYIYARGKSDKEFTVPEGVEYIENGAFYGSSSLVSVTMPDTLRYVYNNAFYSCQSLVSVNNFESVEYVLSSAFYNCTALKSITLGENLMSLGSSAFYYCKALDYVVIKNPDIASQITSTASSAGYIGAYAKAVVVPAEAENSYLAEKYTEIENINLSGKLYISYSDHAHTWDSEDGKAVCSQCGLTKSVPVGEWDISANLDGGLTATLWENMSREGEYFLVIEGEGDMKNFSSANNVAWFSYAGDIVGITLPEGLSSIGNYAFYGCNSVAEIDIPDSVTSLGSYAFYGCSSITEITIGENCTAIGQSAFYSCTGLSYVKIESAEIAKNLYSASSAGYIIANAENLLVPSAFYVPYGIGNIFAYNEEIRCGGKYYISYSNHAHTFSAKTCTVCGLIKDIPTQTWNISSSASYSVYAELWTDPAKSGYYILNITGSGRMLDYSSSPYAPWYSSYATKISTINIGESVTYVGTSAFYGCTHLTKINYNAISASSMGWTPNSTFYNAGTAENGIEVIIGNKVTVIPEGLFYSYRPGSSFYDYTPKITSVVFEEGSVCKTIGDSSFRYLTGLGSIEIPSSVTYIASYAFFGSGLTSIAVPKSVTRIGNWIFAECDSLLFAHIQGSMGTGAGGSDSGSDLFNGCDLLSEVVLPDTTSLISTQVFRDCKALKLVICPGGVTRVGDYAFYGCGNVTVKLPENCTPTGLKLDYVNYTVCDGVMYKLYSMHTHKAEHENWTLDSASLGKNCYCCSICGVVNEVRYAYVSGVRLNLTEDINVMFILSIPETADSYRISFEFMGETFDVDASELTVMEDGRYCLKISKVMPQYMGEEIDVVIDSVCDGWNFNDENGISVRDYCVAMLEKEQSDTELITLLSDLLVYGAAAQKYIGYNTEDLVTNGLTLSATAFTMPEDRIDLIGEADAEVDWVGFGVNCSGTLNSYFTFTAENAEGLEVVISIKDRQITYPVSYFSKDDNGKYKIYLRGIMADELDETVTAAFYKDGVQLGRTLCYSVMSYACYTDVNNGSHLSELIKAICNYGTSAKIYAGGEN